MLVVCVGVNIQFSPSFLVSHLLRKSTTPRTGEIATSSLVQSWWASTRLPGLLASEPPRGHPLEPSFPRERMDFQSSSSWLNSMAFVYARHMLMLSQIAARCPLNPSLWLAICH
ncbi:hypothetical protein FA13DRAFT_1738059 [Coprinellus micaceus]|uniref:Uncharacterized protein n=1 Tax=Coprinellus micaceus TaxID=71717 RepID=A0A4Y7SV36_COPMI|nr:hypothetical protein FA13DRAFT_1738059 [Coprinellus micaceus]